MSVIVAGKEFKTLADEFFVNGQKVLEAYANGVKVYPDFAYRDFALRLSGSSSVLLAPGISDFNNGRFVRLNGSARTHSTGRVVWCADSYVPFYVLTINSRWTSRTDLTAFCADYSPKGKYGFNPSYWANFESHSSPDGYALGFSRGVSLLAEFDCDFVELYREVGCKTSRGDITIPDEVLNDIEYATGRVFAYDEQMSLSMTSFELPNGTTLCFRFDDCSYITQSYSLIDPSDCIIAYVEFDNPGGSGKLCALLACLTFDSVNYSNSKPGFSYPPYTFDDDVWTPVEQAPSWARSATAEKG